VINHETRFTGDELDTSESFGSLAHELVAEHARLTELAGRCRAEGESLAAREAQLAEADRSLAETRRQLAEESRALATWRDELSEKMQVLEQAEQRLAEAREQEMRLAAVGTELLARFGSPAATGD
jgi:DNA repair ATPase RecN